MKPALPRAMRGLKPSMVIVHPEGSDAETLISQAAHLEGDCDLIWPWPQSLPPADIAVLHVEAEAASRIVDLLHDFNGAIIASIDPRDKGVMDGVVAAGVHALLFRPLRVDTVFPQFGLALAIRAHQQSLEKKRLQVEDMLRARRMLEKAVAIVGGSLGLDQDQAYNHLRTLAMQGRQPIAALARTIVESHRPSQS